jgi:hypothetical protein
MIHTYAGVARPDLAHTISKSRTAPTSQNLANRRDATP